MTGALVLDPLLPWPVLWGLAGFAAVLLAVAVWRGLSGWWLRGLTALVVLAAIANPSLQEEERAALSDIVLLVVDDSASQGLGDRAAQVEAAIAGVEAEVARLENTELRVRRFGDAPEDGGTLAMTALAEVLAEEPRARVAGAMLITDGQVHDMELAPDAARAAARAADGARKRLGPAADREERAGLCHSGRRGDADPADRGSGRGTAVEARGGSDDRGR